MFSGQHVAFARGGRPLVGPFSFELKAGEWVWIRGANGAGKSSFLRLLAGFLPCTTGSFRWENAPCALSQASHRKRVAYLGSTYGGGAAEEPVRHTHSFSLLTDWGLQFHQDMPSKFLSQGQQQRLALATIVSLNRPLWLLDEPLQNLDAEGKMIFEKHLASHLANGGLAFIVSHEKLGFQANHQLRFTPKRGEEIA